MTEPQARRVDGLCKTCLQHMRSCKCAHPPVPAFMREVFAAPQENSAIGMVAGRNGPSGSSVANGAPAGAAPSSWLDAIPTAADGVTCRIEDVRRAFLENVSVRPEERLKVDVIPWPVMRSCLEDAGYNRELVHPDCYAKFSYMEFLRLLFERAFSSPLATSFYCKSHAFTGDGRCREQCGQCKVEERNPPQKER